MASQRPLEMILARNLLASVSTPAFLVGEDGYLLFYNEAAGALLGRRFEDTGTMEAPRWTQAFGPFGSGGEPIPYDELQATKAVRENRPFHGNFRISAVDGQREIAASAVPIVGPAGSSGAIVFFWPVKAGEAREEK